jgi:hypothetical protein
MWAKPQHNATVKSRNMAITPKYLNFVERMNAVAFV